VQDQTSCSCALLWVQKRSGTRRLAHSTNFWDSIGPLPDKIKEFGGLNGYDLEKMEIELLER